MLAALPVVGRQAPRDSDADAAVQYLTAPMDDPVAQLQRQIDAGKATLEYYPQHGYLRSVLRALRVPVASQMLVFSKTSFQRDRIAPRTPRALYFNDRCWIGWVQDGEVVEVMAMDPRQGIVFYTLSQTPARKPRFVRQTYDCLQCHQSPMTLGVPGHVMRSVYPRIDGHPDLASGSFVTTHASPLKERWGGWYVTGRHGKQRHLGNVMERGPEGQASLDTDAGSNVTDLRRFFVTAPYLTAHSDIVALLVAEHQGRVQNLITSANYLVRDALRDERRLDLAMGREPEANHRASTLSRLQAACEPLVREMLFVDEAPLTDPIEGTSPFAAQFAAGGTRDRAGRSLRQLDLQRRLLRYPCSWMIYTEHFDALPDLARAYVYNRLQNILSGKDATATFAHLSSSDRQAIDEILRETKPAYAAHAATLPTKGDD